MNLIRNSSISEWCIYISFLLCRFHIGYRCVIQSVLTNRWPYCIVGFISYLKCIPCWAGQTKGCVHKYVQALFFSLSLSNKMKVLHFLQEHSYYSRASISGEEKKHVKASFILLKLDILFFVSDREYVYKKHTHEFSKCRSPTSCHKKC